MSDSSPVEAWGTVQPTYLGSPTPPPDTDAEYLVSWTYGNGLAGARRKVFHTYEKADAYRRRLEAIERDQQYPAQVLVTIHRRDVRQWREIP